MNIILKDDTIKEVVAILTEDEKETFKKKHRWVTGKLDMDVSQLCDESVQKVYDILDAEHKAGGSNARSAALSRGQVKQWQEIKKNPKSGIVTKLASLPAAILALVGTSENRYLFRQLGDGNSVPYFVVSATYSPSQDYSPANVKVGLAAHNSYNSGNYYSHGRRGGSGATTSITFYEEDYRGNTVEAILRRREYFLETTERMTSYEKEMVRFMAIRGTDGHQVNVIGKAIPEGGGYYGSSFRGIEKSGAPAKMVVNPKEEESTPISAMVSDIWNDKGDEHLWEIPYHPFIPLFDLDDHIGVRSHINNITNYEYDEAVGDKLVLEDDTKELLEVLVNHAADSFEDIVSGKQGGSVVLLAGEPGVGKTLTAEVYSEMMKRPLYRVQSSQLGITVEALEEQLKKVLTRSERWGAILLIDEADVYVRERGREIEQNAIVGVFLRVLEYYRGVLFMTTNRGTDIDDAIISRLTASVTYSMPSQGNQQKLWEVLSKQNGVDLSQRDMATILTNHPSLSGRDIKNLLKLASRMASAKNEKVTPELIKRVSKFQRLAGDAK